MLLIWLIDWQVQEALGVGEQLRRMEALGLSLSLIFEEIAMATVVVFCLRGGNP